MATKITENSFLSLTVVGVVIGGIMWLTTLYAQTQEVARAVAVVQTQQASYAVDLADIKQTLAVMAEQMKRLKR